MVTVGLRSSGLTILRSCSGAGISARYATHLVLFLDSLPGPEPIRLACLLLLLLELLPV